jgi:hypothetical protein
MELFNETMWIILGIAVLISLVIQVFYLVTVYNTMKLVSPENRHMSPGMVWISIIPVVNLIWDFYMVSNVASSISDELRARGIEHSEERPGYSVGTAWCICAIIRVIPFFGFIGTLAGLAALVCWIIHWVKIYNCKTKLEQHTGPTDTGILDRGV